MNIAFAGFKHSHIMVLYNMALACPDTNVVGAWEADASFRAQAAEKGVSFTYASLEALLADKNVDIVAIGDQYGDRGGLIKAALRAGKHVMADKPLCTSLSELREIRALAEKTGKKVHCLYSLRYMPRFRAVKAFIESGGLGKVHNIFFGGQHPLRYGTRPGWYFEKGKHGGVINDIAIHGIDAVRYLCGLRPEEILAARCWNAYADKEPGFLDSAQFMLRLSGGAGLLADVSYAAPDSQGFSTPLYWTFDIFGTGGALRFSPAQEIKVYLCGETEGKTLPDADARDEMADFLAEIRGGENTCLCTEEVLLSAEDTLKIQAFADAQG